MRRLTIAVFATLFAACGGKTMTPQAQPSGYLDVTLPPYGAKGDGATDDTAAFQQALDDAGAAGGGIVLAPTGRYRIKTHLSIPPSTTLKGIFVAPPNIDRHEIASLTHGWGSMLLAEEGAGSDGGTPFITLAGHNAAIDGFLVFYPNQTPTNPPVKYPWTVSVGSDPSKDKRALDVSIQNLTLANSYDGIDLGSHESSRHIVTNIYGQPLHRGVFVDQCYDFGVMQNIHFDVFWSTSQALLDFTYAEGIAYLFHRSDGELMTDVNAWGFNVGMQFENPPDRPTDFGSYAFITNLGLESCDVGILAVDTVGSGINIVNYDYATPVMGPRRLAVYLPSANAVHGGVVSISNASIVGAYRQIARSEQPGGFLSLTASNFEPTVETGSPLIEILAGDAVVSNDRFPYGVAAYPAIHVAQAANEVTVTGNLVGFGQITVDPGAPHTVVANNSSF